MRIAQPVRTLVALILLSSYMCQAVSRVSVNSSTVSTQHPHRHHSRTKPLHHQPAHANTSSIGSASFEFGRWLSPPEAQLLLRLEGSKRPAGGPSGQYEPVDCCPSVVEMVEPEGGKNMDGMYVQLYRDGTNRQRFYEVSCRPEVLDKPCRFLDKKLHNQSKCQQKLSYTYALVKGGAAGSGGQFPGGSGPGGSAWSLDYIQVRSGCSCVLQAKPKPAKTPRGRVRHRHQHTLIPPADTQPT